MNDIRTKGEALLEAFEDFQREVQQTDKQAYARWKAGGFIVSDDIICMYGTVSSLIEQLNDSSEEEDNNNY